MKESKREIRQVADRWLSVRLEMMGNVIVFIVSMLCITASSRRALNPGMAGTLHLLINHSNVFKRPCFDKCIGSNGLAKLGCSVLCRDREYDEFSREDSIYDG